MPQVQVDAELLAKLHDLKVPLELCDPSGKVLTSVNPVIDMDD